MLGNTQSHRPEKLGFAVEARFLHKKSSHKPSKPCIKNCDCRVHPRTQKRLPRTTGGTVALVIEIVDFDSSLDEASHKCD
ncbi:unnamed protein product [Mesocestoides corti]|uniref:Uncharacterized protein n=1 Tax=Mesocestoides corti TaxID=53468 RepID=A0A0R3UDH2_MESCO|nr:unnamed protein product [Mesocestoides corti]